MILPGVNPEHALGSFQVLTLLPNLFPLSSLCVLWTPLEKAPSPSPLGAFALGSIQGCCPAQSMGFAFPEHHIPVTFPADSWESPQVPPPPWDTQAEARRCFPKTPGYLPSHFLLGWGFSLAPGTLIIPSTFPRLGIGIPGMQLEHSGSISRKTILAGQPIPGMLLMPLEICCSEGNSSQFLRI